MSTPVHRRRTSALGPTEMLLLRQWGETLYELLDKMPYLVGSVMQGTEWRDVDVRVMVDADHPFALLHEDSLRAVNCAFTVWGQRTTGLPIDFQFQRTDEANAEYGGHPRNPLGSLLGRGWRKRRDAERDGSTSPMSADEQIHAPSIEELLALPDDAPRFVPSDENKPCGTCGSTVYPGHTHDLGDRCPPCSDAHDRRLTAQIDGSGSV